MLIETVIETRRCTIELNSVINIVLFPGPNCKNNSRLLIIKAVEHGRVSRVLGQGRRTNIAVHKQ